MDQRALVKEIISKTPDELEILYDIEIYEDGHVYDPIENREYENLSDWALASIQLDLTTTYTKLRKTTYLED